MTNRFDKYKITIEFLLVAIFRQAPIEWGVFLCPGKVIISADSLKVKLCKHVIYLTPGEIESLLKRDMELYREAIIRGKAFQRRRQELSRPARVPKRMI